jgi:transposase
LPTGLLHKGVLSIRVALDDSVMGQRFVGCDRDQVFLMPPSLREWLPEDHFAWFVIAAIDKMDLAPFYGVYRQDGHGRPAHDPAMMLGLLTYGYARGLRSSRRVERACIEDIAFRVIAANQVPDHCTISRFRQRHEVALAGIFSEVLALCADAGLVGTDVIAVDGTKVMANASREANMDYDKLAQEILEEAAEVDRREDEQYGEARGDELPPHLAGRQGREAWLRDAKRRLDEKRAREARPIPHERPARLKEAKRRLEEELEFECHANAAYEAYRARGVDKLGRGLGRPPNPYQPPEKPSGTMNVTDPDSRMIKATLGYIQGYNAQAAANENQIVIAAEVTPVAADFGQLQPIVEAALNELAQVGITDTPDVVLADAGYWHQVQMENVVNHGIQVLIPPDGGKRTQARPGWEGGLYAFMRRVLKTDRGSELYRKRKTMIETVFADTKFNRRIDRFQRRGTAACRSEWRLITATHNLIKLHRHQLALAAA